MRVDYEGRRVIELVNGRSGRRARGRPGGCSILRSIATAKPITAIVNFAKPTRRACKRAGIESVSFHQLRHTYASHLAQQVPLGVVGAVLGHIDPKTTKRYAHLDTESIARSPKLHLDFTASTRR